jgi:hypothetical protein
VVAVMSASESGVTWMSYADNWVVWAQGESHDVLGNWTIQAWNVQTREKVQVATSQLPDGTFLTGELVFPVAGNGYVAWNQPTSTSSADLRLYRFASRDFITLDSGQLSSPVFASRYLVWAKHVGSDPQSSLRFADAQTLQSVAAPSELSKSYAINYLAGSYGYLLWIGNSSSPTSSSSDLMADNLATGRITQYTSASHYLQFPTLAGNYLVWFAATVDAVVDLSTGAGFDIPLPGGVTASGDTIVVAKLAAGVKGGVTSTTISVLHPSALTNIGSCAGQSVTDNPLGRMSDKPELQAHCPYAPRGAGRPLPAFQPRLMHTILRVPRIFLRCTDSRPEEVQIRPPRLFRPEFPHFNWSTHRPVTTPLLTRGLWDLRRAGHPAQQPPENRCEHKHDEQTSAAADDERRPGRGQIE